MTLYRLYPLIQNSKNLGGVSSVLFAPLLGGGEKACAHAHIGYGHIYITAIKQKMKRNVRKTKHKVRKMKKEVKKTENYLALTGCRTSLLFTACPAPAPQKYHSAFRILSLKDPPRNIIRMCVLAGSKDSIVFDRYGCFHI